jgi:hypothetical protein
MWLFNTSENNFLGFKCVMIWFTFLNTMTIYISPIWPEKSVMKIITCVTFQ